MIELFSRIRITFPEANTLPKHSLLQFIIPEYFHRMMKMIFTVGCPVSITSSQRLFVPEEDD
jgi:hypothetical protein